MRRTILFAFFLLAACGGGVRSVDAVNRSADMRADAQRVLLTAEARTALAEFAKSSSQDALDTCVSAWVDEFGGAGGLHEPIAKPDVAGLRGFLAQCLAGSVPGDLRAAPVGANGAAGLRIDRAGDAHPSDIPVVHYTDKSSN